MEEKFYQSVLERLNELATKKGLTFHPETSPGFEWMQTILISPRVRRRFAIEGKSSAIMGMIVVPNTERKQSDKAWNRLDPPLPQKIEELERDGYEGNRLSVVIVQVWERERVTVLVPAKELRNTKAYRDTGNFRILKDCGEFKLETVKRNGEAEIKLRDRLEEILRLLPS